MTAQVPRSNFDGPAPWTNNEHRSPRQSPAPFNGPFETPSPINQYGFQNQASRGIGEPLTDRIPIIRQSPAQHPNPGGYTETPLHLAVQEHSTEFDDHLPENFNPADAPAREIVPSVNKPSWVKRGLAAVATVGVLGVGISGWNYLKLRNDTDGFTEPLGNDKSASAEPFNNSQSSETVLVPVMGDADGDRVVTKQEISSLDPSEDEDAEVIKSIEPGFLVEAYAADLDSWRQPTLEILKQHTTSTQADTLSLPLTEDKSAYTDQEVLNAIAIDLADASVQKNDPADGQRMLPMIIDRDCPGFDGYFNKITDGGMIIDINKQIDESLSPPTSSFMGHDLNKPTITQARVIKWENIPGGPESESEDYNRYGLYALHETNGKSAWQLVDKWNVTDHKVMQAVKALNK